VGRPLRPRAAHALCIMNAIEIIGRRSLGVCFINACWALILFTLRRAIGLCVCIRCMIIGEECVEASRHLLFQRAFLAIYPHTAERRAFNYVTATPHQRMRFIVSPLNWNVGSDRRVVKDDPASKTNAYSILLMNLLFSCSFFGSLTIIGTKRDWYSSP
jgi:hypothetical protein